MCVTLCDQEFNHSAAGMAAVSLAMPMNQLDGNVDARSCTSLCCPWAPLCAAWQHQAAHGRPRTQLGGRTHHGQSLGAVVRSWDVHSQLHSSIALLTHHHSPFAPNYGQSLAGLCLVGNEGMKIETLFNMSFVRILYVVWSGKHVCLERKLLLYQ